MNKFLIGAMTAIVGISGAAAPALANPFHGHDRVVVKQVVMKQPRYHGWRKGDRFDHRYARDYRVISNPRMYRLHDAPRGYHWVRAGNDAVLVGVTSGIIAAIMANAIR